MSVHLLNVETGEFVSQEHQRVAEMIREYSSELSLLWIKPEHRDNDEQFPFAILHSPANRPAYVVRKVRQIDLNEKLIQWLYHSEHLGDLNAWADGQELAEKMYNAKIEKEKQEEMADFAVSVLKGKNWYRHGGKIYS